MNVQENMTKFVVTINPETSMEEAWQILNRSGFRHLPVTQDHKLLGIVSDRDLLVYDPENKSLPELSVTECMSPFPISCSRRCTISQAATLMINNKIDCLPVVESGILIGLITSTDLIELLTGGLSPQPEYLPWEFKIKLPNLSTAM